MPILGIDEVGRGPLAGPLVVGAVILPEDKREWFFKLKDSKKLTAKAREELNAIILNEAATGLGWVPATELDQLGISKALQIATRRAVKAVQSLHVPFSQIIIDGKVNFLQSTPLAPFVSTCIKADAKIHEVSAASIIAKVARDHYMINLATKYPNYKFDQHVGYGTKTHLAAIYEYGLTPEHRKSFEPCKSLSGFLKPESESKKNTTNIGHQAEQVVTNYLKDQGHTIIENNHKTYFYEIDIISTKDNYIYFTEVKYRKSLIHGDGLNAITRSKLQKMHFAAESYLKYQNIRFKSYQPLLAVASITGNLAKPEYATINWFPLPEK
ncbi:ribonuclease HII [Candidatus Saccharibacteria bacterium]|nr:ribonuclease HII [Candidatus Saccharibacteria bacterium]